jgi:DME family drug/metabolite transporter
VSSLLNTAEQSVQIHRRGIGLIALAGTLWGTVGVATQSIYHMTAAATPLSIGFFRLALAAPALVIACLLVLGRAAWRISGRDIAIMAVMGTMLALYQVCFFTAISHIGVTVATLVTLCTAPVIVAIVSALFTREQPNRMVILALVAAVCGTILLIGTPKNGPTAGNTLTGILFALGSAFGYAILAIAGRRVAERAHTLQTNAVAFTAGALVLLLLTIPAGGPLLTYPIAGWGLLLYLGLIPTALGYGLFLIGMRTTPATVASIVTLVEPLMATFLAWQLFGEQLGALGLIGAVLLIGALILLARRG